jgi:hypothetical protein
VALVRKDVSEKRIATFIRVTGTGEARTALAVTSSRSTVIAQSCHPDDGDDTFALNVGSSTSKKTAFFIATAVKTSNLTYFGIDKITILVYNPYKLTLNAQNCLYIMVSDPE